MRGVYIQRHNDEECIDRLLERDKSIDNIYDVLDKVDTDIE